MNITCKTCPCPHTKLIYIIYKIDFIVPNMPFRMRTTRSFLQSRVCHWSIGQSNARYMLCSAPTIPLLCSYPPLFLRKGLSALTDGSHRFFRKWARNFFASSGKSRMSAGEGSIHIMLLTSREYNLQCALIYYIYYWWTGNRIEPSTKNWIYGTITICLRWLGVRASMS
jgi:hypothetical protein